MIVTVSTLQDSKASSTATRIGPAHMPLTPGTEIKFWFLTPDSQECTEINQIQI
jgi:hypothetical protein